MYIYIYTYIINIIYIYYVLINYIYILCINYKYILILSYINKRSAQAMMSQVKHHMASLEILPLHAPRNAAESTQQSWRHFLVVLHHHSWWERPFDGFATEPKLAVGSQLGTMIPWAETTLNEFVARIRLIGWNPSYQLDYCCLFGLDSQSFTSQGASILASTWPILDTLHFL